jgi:hypothetical protein
MNLDHLYEMRGMLSIAHHVPGRLRLKLDPRIREHPGAALIESLSKRLPDTGLLHVRLNPMARSLVLGYDTSRIAPQVLEEFLVSRDAARVAELAETIATFFGVTLEA